MPHSSKSLPVVSLDEKNGERNCCAPAVTQSCCGTGKNLPACVTGIVETSAGPVPRITHMWTREDRAGQIRCRVSAFRMSYRVEPGLYAVGEPSEESDVLVTANYKLTFDILRRELAGMNLWILVLDTKGINVWCAAGKGTFGTPELIRRIKSSALARIVRHRRLILPQLGAPGVSAGEVRKNTGFNVKYGPVRAGDIVKYITDGYSATPAMRTVTFTFAERTVLMPMEFIPATRKLLPAALALLVIAGLYPHGILFMEMFRNGFPFLGALFFAIFAGACFSPVMLPWIPGRSFAFKGFLSGLVAAAAFVYIFPDTVRNTFLLTAVVTGIPALASYLALQFTGSTPFTNMTGVKKEVRWSLPVQIAGIMASAAAVIAWKLSTWGIL